jgi:Photosynthesis system II assembly factor YCF48
VGPEPNSPRRRAATTAALFAVLAGTVMSGTGSGVMPAPSLTPASVRLPTEALAAPVMEATNAPARIARVAIRPGSGGSEAWAFGYTSAIGDGRQPADALGQVIFLHYLRDTGWQLDDVPRTGSGQATNPRLSALAVTPTDEVWAVGADGVLVHHAAGGGGWQAGSSVAGVTLESVSLSTSSSGAVTGYAVGDQKGNAITVLHLSGGAWQPDGAHNLSGKTPDLVSVSVSPANPDDAWAVSGDSSQTLVVLHRTSLGWQAVPTGEPMFDSPPAPTQNDGTPQGTVNGTSTQNQAASGGGVAATPDGGAWVVGRISPTDATHPFGDAVTGDSSRPFAISLTPSGAVSGFTAKSYCPALDTVTANTGGSAGTTAVQQKLCDDVFPLAAFGLTAVQALDGGEVFAAGMGLFHFSGGRWVRETDAVGYLNSLSFGSPTEGWVAGTGSNAISGGAFSETIAMGHWTTQPIVPGIARWPQTQQQPLEGVALDPGGSGQALAVGTDGAASRYLPGHGWQELPRQTSDSMHAIAWPATGSAWAVGNGGTLLHWDGAGWSESFVPLNGPLDVRPNLYGVAFSDAGHGWAVGDAGAIYSYSGGRWRVDRAHAANQPALYTVVATRSGEVVAAGDGGTVLVHRGAGWQDDSGAEGLATQPGTPPPGATQPVASFFASAALPDGTIALGGSHGTFLVGPVDPPGSLKRGASSPEGSITALALSGSGGAYSVIAALSPRSDRKYVGGQLATTEGWVTVGDASGWHDVEFGHALTMWTSTDTAAQRDAVYGIAVEPGSLRGWAVGGYPALTADDDNHSYQRADASASTYRVDVGGNPSPPSTGTVLPDPPTSGFTFAYLGDSACAGGVCGAALGSGPMADVVLLQAQQEINQVAPSLTVFGGDMRRTGLPEELDEFKRFIAGWTMPVYAAMGSQDLVSGFDTGQIFPGAPSQSGVTGSSALASNTLYGQVFAQQPAPWGATRPNAAPPRGVTARPVSADGTPDPSRANTHYAFDYAPDGLPTQARFIVLNTSGGSLEQSSENPPVNGAQGQITWLGQEIAAARAEGVPAIVVMNQPPADPRGVRTDGSVLLDGAAFDAAMVQSPAAAVMASGIHANLAGQVPGTSVPLYVSGGAGSPLVGDRVPLHGYYHAWMLVTVDPAHPGPSGQASVSVQSMPVLEAVSLRIIPRAGSLQSGIPAGSPATVRAFGRLPDSGLGNLNGSNPDPTQSRAQFLQVPDPYSGAVGCLPGTESPYCTIPGALQPYHRFWSEDPTIADFVQPCPSAENPVFGCPDANGNLIPDDQSGFLCTFQPGTVWIDSVVGIHKAREQITVTAGSGSACKGHVPPPVCTTCGPHVVNATVHVNPEPVPQPAAPPAPAVVPRLHHPVFFHPFNSNLVPAVLPPPVPVLAAAPPLPAAGTAAKKEEEREKALEHSKESGDGHTHQAVAYSQSPNDGWDARPTAAVGAALLLMLIAMSAWASSRRRPQAAFDVSRWE